MFDLDCAFLIKSTCACKCSSGEIRIPRNEWKKRIDKFIHAINILVFNYANLLSLEKKIEIELIKLVPGTTHRIQKWRLDKARQLALIIDFLSEEVEESPTTDLIKLMVVKNMFKKQKDSYSFFDELDLIFDV